MFDRSLIDSGARLAGRVRAVFDHAALVWDEGDGRILTLLDPDGTLVPMGVRIPWQPPPRLDEIVVLAGRWLQVGERRLHLDGEGSPLTLDEAPPPSAAVMATQVAAIPLPDRTRRLLGAEAPDGESFEGATIDRLAGELARMVTAMTGGDLASIVAGAGRMAGLGPGATPSGDDLLVGLAAAARRWSEVGWVDRRVHDEISLALRALPRQATTQVGRQMLGHAACGLFLEPLRDLVIGLGTDGWDGEAAGARLAAVGGHTGSDMLAGVVALARGLTRRKGGSS